MIARQLLQDLFPKNLPCLNSIHISDRDLYYYNDYSLMLNQPLDWPNKHKTQKILNQMTLQGLASIGELIAGIAIIISLAYLAI